MLAILSSTDYVVQSHVQSEKCCLARQSAKVQKMKQKRRESEQKATFDNILTAVILHTNWISLVTCL